MDKLFVLYSVQADSWNGSETPVSFHKTLEGAVQAVPERFREDERKTPSYSKRTVIRDYTYYNIQEKELQV